MALGPMAVDFEERVDFRRLHRLSPGPDAPGARQLGARRDPGLRPVQYPLHLLDGDRRMGARQADALCAADRQWRSLCVGFRLGRQAPSALCALAASRSLPGRPARPARRDPSQGRAVQRAAEEIKAILEEEGVADMPLGVDVAELPMIFELQEARARSARRAAGHARCTRDQEPGRADAAQHVGGDGRRHLSEIAEQAETRRPRKPDRGAGQHTIFYERARTVSRRSTPSRASAASPIRTISPIA